MKSPVPLRDGRTLVIEQATRQHAAALVEHANRVGGETNHLAFGGGEFDVTLAEETAFLGKVSSSRTSFILLGILEDEMVAVTSVVGPRRPRLHHMAEMGVTVVAQCWGMGIGRRMCETAIAQARERGLLKLNLRVHEDNLRATSLYQALGFRREGTITRALLVNGQFFAEHVMGLWLD